MIFIGKFGMIWDFFNLLDRFKFFEGVGGI